MMHSLLLSNVDVLSLFSVPSYNPTLHQTHHTLSHLTEEYQNRMEETHTFSLNRVMPKENGEALYLYHKPYPSACAYTES
jgi:hypothetical protein